MQTEWEFMVFDGTMILIVSTCLTVLHPGTCFKEIQMHKNGVAVAAGNEKEGNLEAGTAKPKRGMFGRKGKA